MYYRLVATASGSDYQLNVSRSESDLESQATVFEKLVHGNGLVSSIRVERLSDNAITFEAVSSPTLSSQPA